MAKRGPDLDALDPLVVPKGEAQPKQRSDGTPARGYAHTLSLRLTADAYRRLRRFVADQEDKSGSRMTHQSVIETALAEYLERHGG